MMINKLSNNWIINSYGMGDSINYKIARLYEASLRLHIKSVQEAGERLGVNSYQLFVHDESKWSVEEFPFYARRSHGDGNYNNIDYTLAWLHHIHNNPHHWQYWIFSDSYKKHTENGVCRMPENYALEMVADWMGAGVAYNKSEDMSEWLISDLHKITVHSETVKYLTGILNDLGYGKILDKTSFNVRV